MQLTINGENHEYDGPLTVMELLEIMRLKNKFVAVERNFEVISYKNYHDVTLDDGDQLEIVTLVGGG